MQRRSFPSILLYGFGLALALSLAFNGFLLYEQSRHLSLYEVELNNSIHPVEQAVWQQQLSECQRANLQKDSLIRRLEPVPNAPPAQLGAIQRATLK
ncbi:hypothetical protein GCM10028773_23270 [Spirosoma koreense]